MAQPNLNIALLVSGSIACYKACDLASQLMKDGHQVQVVATKSALRFVGTASFEGLTDRKVYTSLWAPRESKTHISLRRWADLFVFYPATANRIAMMAAGIAHDLIGATFLANNFEKPFWIAPAANTNMMRHPATQAALERLEGWGCRLIYGDSGRLACGDIGLGRLAEPAILRAAVREHARQLARQGRSTGSKTAPRALVTGGAMSLQVDAVRSIINTSSGQTAAACVAALLDAGWEVDYLAHHSASIVGCEGATIQRYHDFDQFKASLEAALQAKPYSLVLHAAAVSDYHLASGSSGAKRETSQAFQLELAPNPKLLPLVKGLARAAGHPEPFVIGFKLTVHETEADGMRRATSYFEGGRVDRVIWNDLDGLNGEEHVFSLLRAGLTGVEVLGRGQTQTEIAATVLAEAEAATGGRA